MQPRSVYIGGNYQLLPMFSNFFRKFLRKQERPGGGLQEQEGTP